MADVPLLLKYKPIKRGPVSARDTVLQGFAKSHTSGRFPTRQKAHGGDFGESICDVNDISTCEARTTAKDYLSNSAGASIPWRSAGRQAEAGYSFVLGVSHADSPGLCSPSLAHVHLTVFGIKAPHDVERPGRDLDFE
jgi:hypothetical protein